MSSRSAPSPGGAKRGSASFVMSHTPRAHRSAYDSAERAWAMPMATAHARDGAGREAASAGRRSLACVLEGSRTVRQVARTLKRGHAASSGKNALPTPHTQQHARLARLAQRTKLRPLLQQVVAVLEEAIGVRRRIGSSLRSASYRRAQKGGTPGTRPLVRGASCALSAPRASLSCARPLLLLPRLPIVAPLRRCAVAGRATSLSFARGTGAGAAAAASSAQLRVVPRPPSPRPAAYPLRAKPSCAKKAQITRCSRRSTTTADSQQPAATRRSSSNSGSSSSSSGSSSGAAAPAAAQQRRRQSLGFGTRGTRMGTSS